MMAVDYRRLATWLVPTFMRRGALGWLLAAAVRGLEADKQDYDANRAANLRHIAQTGQVCRLRGLLNDTFDPLDRRIRVVDVNYSLWLMAYRERYMTEADMVLWVPREGYVMCSREGRFDPDNDFDFTVVLPPGMVVDDARLRAVVDRYKLAATIYSITN